MRRTDRLDVDARPLERAPHELVVVELARHERRAFPTQRRRAALEHVEPAHAPVLGVLILSPETAMRLREDGASVDAFEEVGPRIGHHSSLLASRRRRPRRARRGVARRPHPQAAARCRVRSGARERKLASSQTFFSRVVVSRKQVI